jgi:hypothetical protein
MNRKDILLRAAFDLIARSEMSSFVLAPGEVMVHYDDADCDGLCLKEDIANELGISVDEYPIDLDDEEEEA